MHNQPHAIRPLNDAVRLMPIGAVVLIALLVSSIPPVYALDHTISWPGSSSQSTTSEDGTLLPKDFSERLAACFSTSNTSESTGSDDVHAIPIFTFFSPNWIDFAQNLAESIFTVHRWANDRAGDVELPDDPGKPLDKKLLLQRRLFGHPACFFPLVAHRKNNMGSSSIGVPTAQGAGSDVYFSFLETKLKLFREILGHHGLQERWILLLDVDTQLFPEAVRLVTSKIRDVAESPTQNQMRFFFQREGDGINSGVVMVKAGNASLAVYNKAQQVFRRADLGDQTAINHVLLVAGRMRYRKRRFWNFFSKKVVNAGQIHAQLRGLAIHHAHMSGAFKVKNLRAAVAFKRAQMESRAGTTGAATGSCSSTKRESGGSRGVQQMCPVHTGAFLDFSQAKWMQPADRAQAVAEQADRMAKGIDPAIKALVLRAIPGPQPQS